MSLRMNFGSTAASRAVYALSQWLLLVCVARLESPEQLGEFAYALAVVSPLIIFAQLNMRAYMATDSDSKFTFGDFLNAQIVTLVLAMAGAIAVGWAGGQSGHAFLVILAVVLYKSVESISGIHYGALQREERMSPIAVSVTAHGVLAVLAMAVATAVFGNVLYGAVGIAAAWMIILVAYDVPQSRRFRALPAADDATPLTSRRVWNVIVCCFPLGIVLAMLSLRINIPVYFVQAEWGSAHVGFYSAIAYFVVAGNMITGSLLQAAAPRMANHHRDGRVDAGRKLFVKLMFVATAVGAAGVVGAWAVGRPLLEWVYGIEYGQHYDVLVWVMGAAAVMYVSQLFGLALTVTRSFRWQVMAGATGIAATLALSAWLVPQHALVGAAQALLGGSLATLLANVVSAYARVPFLSFRSVPNRRRAPRVAP